MSEPATKEDVEALRVEMHARFERSDASVEGMRSQNSAEHGSIIMKLLHVTQLMHWLRAKWEHFSHNGQPPEPPHD